MKKGFMSPRFTNCLYTKTVLLLQEFSIVQKLKSLYIDVTNYCHGNYTVHLHTSMSHLEPTKILDYKEDANLMPNYICELVLHKKCRN